MGVMLCTQELMVDRYPVLAAWERARTPEFERAHTILLSEFRLISSEPQGSLLTAVLNGLWGEKRPSFPPEDLHPVLEAALDCWTEHVLCGSLRTWRELKLEAQRTGGGCVFDDATMRRLRQLEGVVHGDDDAASISAQSLVVTATHR